MTHIEFFDTNDVENVCSPLACKQIPDKIYLLCGSTKEANARIGRYKELFKNRGFDTEFVSVAVNRNDLKQTVSKIESVIGESDDEFAFDLTGGDDLCLVAVGIIAERYKDRKFQFHRYNVESGRMIDCDDDKTTEYISPVKLTVDENIKLLGGKVLTPEERRDGGDEWDFTRDFISDIGLMWSVMSKDEPSVWNGLSNILQYLSTKSSSDDRLTIKTKASQVSSLSASQNNTLGKDKRKLLSELKKHGLITEYVYDDKENVFCVKFKNHQVKRCIMKSGQLMELKVYTAMARARENDKGELFYNDVQTSVNIDWDGKLQTEEPDTGNEIDVMAMHGIVPVFVSCKNGSIDKNEIYKLETVATRFGNRYAKKVIITNLRSDDIYMQSTFLRAESMGIRIVYDFYKMKDDEIDKCIRSFFLKK